MEKLSRGAEERSGRGAEGWKKAAEERRGRGEELRKQKGRKNLLPLCPMRLSPSAPLPLCRLCYDVTLCTVEISCRRLQSPSSCCLRQNH